jgi:PEGA domain-containing protein
VLTPAALRSASRSSRRLRCRGGAVVAIAAWIVLGAPVAARADGIGVVAAGSADDRAAISAALVEAIAAGGPRGRVVADAVSEARTAVAAGAVPAATLAQFRRVRAMIDDGWRAFLRVQIDVAQNRLAAARREAEALVVLPGGAELYADAALRLGAVMQYRRLAESPAVLALALALDPARPITLAEFSPDVVDAVAAVRAATPPVQRLHVTTRPAGAIVSIDGKELGASPIDADVPRGQHLVVARAPQHRPIVQGVAVDAAAAAVALALDPDDDAARLAGGAEPGLGAAAEQSLVDAALTFADVDVVIVAAIADRHGAPALIAQRCSGTPVRCSAPAEIGFGDRTGLAAAAREAWQAVQHGELREPPRVLGGVEHRVAPSGCPLCRNPLVWTGVGAAVLTTLIVIAVTSGSRPSPVLTVHGGDFGHP